MHEESPRGPVTLSSLTGILSFWDSTLQDLLLFTVLASVFLPFRCFGPQRGFLLCYRSAMKPLVPPGRHQLRLPEAKIFYPVATGLIKALVVSYHLSLSLFFFSDTQNWMIHWHGRGDNGKKKNWIWDTVWTESQLDLVTSYRKRKIQCQLLELNFKDFLYGERMRKLPLGISWNMKSYGAGEIHDWHTFYKVGGPGLHISRSKEKSYICECHYLAVCNHTDLRYMQKVSTKEINRQIDTGYFV